MFLVIILSMRPNKRLLTVQFDLTKETFKENILHKQMQWATKVLETVKKMTLFDT